MKELFVAATVLQQHLESRGWRFCFIGGVAVQRWGENRVTRDLDLTVFTRFTNDEQYIREALSFLKPRRSDAADFALASRVLLAQTDDGTPVDLALGGLPFEEEMIEESSYFTFIEGVTLRTCSAESLVVMKAFADRSRDWEDVRGILVRQGTDLKRTTIMHRLTPLVALKEEPEILERLQKLFQEVPV